MEIEAGKESDSVDFDVDIAESIGNITPTKSALSIIVFESLVISLIFLTFCIR